MTTMSLPGPTRTHFTKRAFTLVELLVSMVVLVLLFVMLEQLTTGTQKTMASTLQKIEEFRTARQAFEAMTRRLSQATLNTYWDYAYAPGTRVPTSYVRQSELRFISGSTAALGIAPSANLAFRPTHAIFFQAPLGQASDANYHGLDNLLNTWGYCVEYGDDKQTRPAFLASLNPGLAARNRFRLLEVEEPSESFSLYQKEAALNNSSTNTGGNAAYVGKDWFSGILGDIPATGVAGAPPRPVHVLAENVVALILLPKLAQEDQNPVGHPNLYDDSSLSPYYLYDSVSTSNNSENSPYYVASAPADLNPKHQLPPIVQVTMVAVDEVSFRRYQNTRSVDDQANKPPDFSMPAGSSTSAANPVFRSNSKSIAYAQDLQTLQANLQSYHLNYRVFNTSVSLKAAKWSRLQTN